MGTVHVLQRLHGSLQRMERQTHASAGVEILRGMLRMLLRSRLCLPFRKK